MTHKPRFSVVVPAYNAEATLPDTLDAILAQSFGDWECVVVDDGSTDRTLALARTYEMRDPRVRVVAQANRGTGGAYNAGVTAARGAFIVLCSADDLLAADHLEVMARAIDECDACDIYSANGSYLSPDGTTQPVYGPDDMPASLSLTQLIRGCFYGVGATYRRELFDRVGGYREGIFGEDYDFWLRAMALGARHCYVPQPLSLHRLSASQKSSQTEAVLCSDIRMLTDLEATGRLTRAERGAVHDSVCGRLAQIALLDRSPMRRSVRYVLTYLARPASLARALARRTRRRAG